MEPAFLGAVGLVWILVHCVLAVAGLVVALKLRRTAPRAGALLACGFACKIAAGALSVCAPIAGWLTLDAADSSTAIAVSGAVDVLSTLTRVAALGLIFAGFLGWLRRPHPVPHAADLTGAR
ncbi:hypothetical protein HUT06_36555 [Actinomadura sp. NAK00032]|uniref:hypothetical protein n=1 Tax=Actinomadura sp. NAK00032 TaxID=2742128 RepID=UPI0015916801|nr:hypothetical protein [Actinomadura sp. NAK00032]QKW38859.1 hypothetical protein HUT06_36555 [Actinomadura sp. NAK00032]